MNHGSHRRWRFPLPPSLAGCNWGEPCVPLTQASWSGPILTRRKCLFASRRGQPGAGRWLSRGPSCPPDPHSTLRQAPKPPRAAGFRVALFFHLLRSPEAWELWGDSRRKPPPPSELQALPQEDAVATLRPTPGVAHVGDSPRELVSSLQGHRGDAGCGPGSSFSNPASPSWLLPEEPARSRPRRAFPAPPRLQGGSGALPALPGTFRWEEAPPG